MTDRHGQYVNLGIAACIGALLALLDPTGTLVIAAVGLWFAALAFARLYGTSDYHKTRQ